MAEGRLTPDDLRDGRAEAALAVAERRFDHGAAALGNPALAPLRFVPVVGRQLRSAERLGRAAHRIAAVGRAAAHDLRPAFDDPPAGAAGRLAAVARLEAASQKVEAGLRSVDLGPDRGLVGPLAEARFDLATKLADARRQAAHAHDATTALGQLLRGPRRLLLLAANNAEMRAGSGMFLSAGILDVRDGEFDLSDMETTGDLVLDGDGVTAPGDLGALWGWAHPGRDWRNLGLTPRFDTTAPLAAQMWEARGEAPVDGVVAVDVPALAALLAATGPVDIAGEEVSEANVAQLLFHDQYEGLAYGDDQAARQDRRRERLGDIASAVVGRLRTGDVDLTVLARRLGDAAAGRHVLVWSRDAAAEAAWTASGVGGTIGPDSLLLSVLNRGGNKLDPYLDVDAEVRSRRRPDGATEVTVRVRLANGAPTGQPPYVSGPRPDQPDIPEGTYVGLLSLTMPAAARDVALGEGAPRQVVGRDGPSQVVATNVDIARGAERRQTITFVLPAGHGPVTVEPGARVPATEWSADGRQWKDEGRRTVPLGG